MPASAVVLAGDRLFTNMRIAKDFRPESIFVLSGETQRVDLKTGSLTPKYIFESVGDILDTQ